MDNNGNSNGQPKRERLRPSLEELLFIPFYTGILTKDISKTGLTDEEFVDLSAEFFKKGSKGITTVDEQLTEIKYDIAILTGSMLTLMKGYDEELAVIVRGFGIKITEERLGEALEFIAFRIKRLHKNYKILETTKPPVPKNVESMTAYDIVASLSANLEFGLNFGTFTVGEYLSYVKVVKSKSDALKKAKNGRSVGKN